MGSSLFLAGGLKEVGSIAGDGKRGICALYSMSVFHDLKVYSC